MVQLHAYAHPFHMQANLPPLDFVFPLETELHVVVREQKQFVRLKTKVVDRGSNPVRIGLKRTRLMSSKTDCELLHFTTFDAKTASTHRYQLALQYACSL